MTERKRDDLGGLADALQRLIKAQQGASTEFSKVAEQIGGVGQEVATLMAEAAAQVAVPRDGGGRTDPQDVLRRVQAQLSQAGDLFRRASELFNQMEQDKAKRSGPKGQEPNPRAGDGGAADGGTGDAKG